MIRPFVVARTLLAVEPDLDVAFAMGGPATEFLRHHGYRAIDVHPLFPAQRQASPSLLALLLAAKKGFKRALEDDQRLLERLRPDVVVSDHRWTSVVACRQRAIPCIGITNAFYTRYRSPRCRLADTLVREHEELLGRLLERPLGDAGWEAPVSGLMEGTRPILADAPALGLATAAATRYLVGPLLWDGGTVADWPAGRGPTVYATTGSTGDVTTINRIVARLLAAGWRVVLSGTGGASLEAHPALRVVPFVRAASVLPGASVALVHGGSGSLYQALRFGIPALVVPGNLDQAIHADALAARGAGLDGHGQSPDVLARWCERLREDPSFKEQASAVGAEIGRLGGATAAAEVIRDQLAAGRRTATA